MVFSFFIKKLFTCKGQMSWRTVIYFFNLICLLHFIYGYYSWMWYHLVLVSIKRRKNIPTVFFYAEFVFSFLVSFLAVFLCFRDATLFDLYIIIASNDLLGKQFLFLLLNFYLEMFIS